MTGRTLDDALRALNAKNFKADAKEMIAELGTVV